MKFILQKMTPSVPARWEDYKAGGDTPKGAINALERAGATGTFRIITVTDTAGTQHGAALDIINFKIVEQKSWKAELDGFLTTPAPSLQSEPPSDSGSKS